MSSVWRTVSRVITPAEVMEGAGVRLHRSFPRGDVDYLDPFLLFDDFSSDEPDDFIKGFPWHPHRGIETVTYLLKGKVNHGDSIGNKGVIGPGDAQWMTSGSGIMHEEMPQAMEGGMTGFQLWVNLPAKLKMSPPRYQDITAGEIPVVRGDQGIEVRVIAGEVEGIAGPVTEIAAQPAYLDVTLPAGSNFTHSTPPGHTVLAYIFEGRAIFGAAEDGGGKPVSRRGFISFCDGEQVRISAGDEDARFLLLAGKPLGEPVARHGPFVMNTREEIEQALRDLRDGNFTRSL
jgi:redox-sensitive bicupin YhaK (pirin superfamily)